MFDRFAQKHPLLLVAIVPIAAQAVGSAFNITYNLNTIVPPLITPRDAESLFDTILLFNAFIYPIAVSCWIYITLQLRRPIEAITTGQPVKPEVLEKAWRLSINLPWWMLGIAGAAWLSCIPFVLTGLLSSPGQIDIHVPIHLAISITVSAMIALTHAFFAIEMTSHRYLFPILFDRVQPSSIKGAYPLSLRGRGIALIVSTVISPIVSILLLFYSAHHGAPHHIIFPVVVGGLGILFGFTSVWMIGHLYGGPVRELVGAAKRIGEGKLDTRVDLLRGDEFGPLIEEFNQMAEGIKEKESIQQMFGLHVGRAAAAQILKQPDPGLTGTIRDVTIVFVDIRDFTSTSHQQRPEATVAILNAFFDAMVNVVESQCYGMVNKYLGDGFMAIFGIQERWDSHADDAVKAGDLMLQKLEDLNRDFVARGLQPLQIGIGIHSGPALVGSIGCSQRLEYTAIGDTVNIASRVESLTKHAEVSILLTESTQRRLQRQWSLVQQPLYRVKGVSDPLTTYSLPKT